MAEQGLAQINAAFETCRDAHHAPNASYYEAQLPAAQALVDGLRKGSLPINSLGQAQNC